MILRSICAAVLLLAGVAFLHGESASTTQPAFEPIGNEHLHNAHRVTDSVISGAQPDDEEAFAALQALGVRTIISVDGAKPNAELARKYGMEYIHLPIGYDAVPREQAQAIAKALIEKPGPFYIHCHHGKHRSAAAVAVACIMTGQLQPEQADSVLKTFGTGENYTGLWQSARDARAVDPAKLHAINADFVEAATIPPFAEAMVHVDHTFDHLKAADAAGWKAIPGHPDIDPPHESLMLREQLHELNRSDDIQDREPAFRELLEKSEQQAGQLEALLKAWKSTGHAGPLPGEIKTTFKALSDTCKACHKEWRD